MLNHIRIVLIHTSHPGNIGAAARAMKTMGLHRLYLVAPKLFPHDQATALASGAEDVLASAVVTQDLMSAISGCHFVLGASMRERGIALPTLNARMAGMKCIDESIQGDIAIVFGAEYAGLSNEELQRCHFRLEIPCVSVTHSLNLAAAVQVIAYEIYMAAGITQHKFQKRQQEIPETAVSSDIMELFYQHLETVLFNINFISLQHPNRIMPRLRRLFNRARPDQVEINILRGILTAIDKKRN